MNITRFFSHLELRMKNGGSNWLQNKYPVDVASEDLTPTTAQMQTDCWKWILLSSGWDRIELQYFFWNPRILNIIHMRNVPVKSSEVLICFYLLLISHRPHINSLVFQEPLGDRGTFAQAILTSILLLSFNKNTVRHKHPAFSCVSAWHNLAKTSSKHIYSNARTKEIYGARHSGGVKAEMCHLYLITAH